MGHCFVLLMILICLHEPQLKKWSMLITQVGSTFDLCIELKSGENGNTGGKKEAARQRSSQLTQGQNGILNVSGLIALMLIDQESGVSCWIGLTHIHTQVHAHEHIHTQTHVFVRELYLLCVTVEPGGLRSGL